MTDSQATGEVAPARPVPRPLFAWILLAVPVLWAGSLWIALGTSDIGISTTAAASILVLTGVSAGAAAIAVTRAAEAGPTLPFAVMATTVATTLALSPFDLPASENSFTSFLMAAPWRYLLTPLVVHFALVVGWSRRERQWRGIVIGWYLLHLGLFLTTLVGLAIPELPLVHAIDETIRGRVVNPAGVAFACVVLGFALVAPGARRSQRRATAWALGAVAIGFGPTALRNVVPAFGASIEGPLTIARALVAVLPVIGLLAVLALPLIDPLDRDLTAHRLAQAILDGPDLGASLQRVTGALVELFEVGGADIRLALPAVYVASGDLRGGARTGPMSHEVETFDDDREMLAPLGRPRDPLGEVRLQARHGGAFGPRERDWFRAFLDPISTAVRSRRRETMAREETERLGREAAEAIAGIHRAAGLLPQAPPLDGGVVPLPVDASEVLAQLDVGVRGIGAQGERLDDFSRDVRARSRATADALARVLDRLLTVSRDVAALSGHGEEVASSNETISGVAFRTNLLANTAALEATRAGDAGRTFGVLADEIRRLADTTAATSQAIGERAGSLRADVVELVAAMSALHAELTEAIRQAETGEEGARRLDESAASLDAAVRAMRPAIEEAHEVARRRSSRDAHLTAELEQLHGERIELSRALTAHHHALGRLIDDFRRIAIAGRSAPRPPGARGQAS
jgi:hypothetical protein